MTDSAYRFSGQLVPGGNASTTQDSAGTKAFSVEGALQVGFVLQNRYRITNVLGMGGMGSVYQARDQRFTNVVRNVAVKEMLNLQTDPQLREQTIRNFGREADVLASLMHPAIPQIYDVFASKERAYLVMEYIDGKDLEAYLDQSQDFIPVETVLKWALELCDVLQFLHTHQPDPIIFRDMKPSNIMIDRSARVRLIDFGIAKPFQPLKMEAGTRIGTEGYAAPEQHYGASTPTVDVYALGATLHHVLTRRDPRHELLHSFLQRPIRQYNPRVPAEMEAFVNKALDPDPLKRFQTALEMKEALEKIGAPQGGRARSETNYFTETSSGFAQSAPLDDVDTGVKPVWKIKVEDEIRSTPVYYKGTVYIGTYDNNLYAFNAADGKPKLKFASHEGISATPAIAPDENLIIFGSEDRKLYALDLRTHRVSWEFETAGPIRSSIMTAHGHAFFGSDDGRLYAVRASNGRQAWRYESGSPIRSRPAVTEDRIVAGNESGDVVGLDLSGSIKWRMKTKRAVTSNIVLHDGIAYIGSQDSHIYAVDAGAGWTAWRFRTQKAIVSSACVEGKMLYIGSADGFLYALDLNGREEWKFKTEGQIVSTPIVFNGVLYFASTDKKVYAIDARRGSKRWEFATDGQITSSPCIAENLLFIGSTDQYLYALNL